MNHLQLTQTLAESFSALANEVQHLVDRKTILEHKLRYAHEQYQILADSYGPAVPEVAETLAKLQLPEIVTTHQVVPLPKRDGASLGEGSSQHQLALLIRQGRMAVSQLSTVSAPNEDAAPSSNQVRQTWPVMHDTTASLERDFTVQGKQGALSCPFTKLDRLGNGVATVGSRRGSNAISGTAADPTPHRSADPICAAMLEEALMPEGGGGERRPSTVNGSKLGAVAPKCPIRYLDQHSPEDIAHYVETHKHEIPRSHEVCLRRNQRNEEQIRKLDAKYGNLVSMIKDLSHLHMPMLPSSSAAAEDGQGYDDEGDGVANGEEGTGEKIAQRVETWAQTVVSSDPEQTPAEDDQDERQSHFDRPLRHVRVGESPSRPWGISVPVYDGRPVSPPPVPVVMPAPVVIAAPHPVLESMVQDEAAPTPVKTCPFGHLAKTKLPSTRPQESTTFRNDEATPTPGASPPHQTKQQHPFVHSDVPRQPTTKGHRRGQGGGGGGGETLDAGPAPQPQPQVVFNISGPVFIGYPMEQAVDFMRNFPGGQAGEGAGRA